MAADTTYEGWTNYETWAWKLWQDNDQGIYEHCRDLTRECWTEAEEGGNPFVEDREGRARILLADRFKELAEEFAPELSGPYADLLNAALGAIDWHEIASAWLDDFDS